MSEAATLEADAGSRKDSEAKKSQTAAARLQLSDWSQVLQRLNPVRGPLSVWTITQGPGSWRS